MLRKLTLFSLVAGCLAISGILVGMLQAGQAPAPAPVTGPPAPKDKPMTAEQLKNLAVGPNCSTSECHVRFMQLKYRHGPTAQGKCDPCHIAVGGKHVFQPADKTNSLCLKCHEPMPEKKVKHPPIHEDCRKCHDVHGENDRFFLVGADIAALCSSCHENKERNLQFVHGPVAQGLCLACHEPHESDNAHLLIATLDQFCQTCHQDVVDLSATALVQHEPFKQKCVDCHTGHGSQFRYLLHQSESDLCQKCHQDDMEAAKKMKVTHEPVAESGKCASCHTAHYSNYAGLLKQTSGLLCLECHDETLKRPNGKEIRNVSAEMAASKFLHGPMSDSNCIACHNAHGSQNISLLNRDFPARFYAAFDSKNYELCWFCHDQQVVMEPKSRDTAFRNGDANMHFLHVNREKGRTCRACHAEHASNNPVHIRDSVPYGNWMMALEFEKTATGGSCATGCHAKYGYDRDNPVKNVTKGQ